ncbi:MAG: ATP synthase F1 subunit gamma [Nitrospirota bacterium]|nr:ATP synthase F1 subunit gamma [Nitrospirota bacterium]
MPSLLPIKRRIASTKNTTQITKAMKMVAASKLRKAQERILEARPYARGMMGVLSSLAKNLNKEYHPLLDRRGTGKIEVIVLTSDRGLCGGFNTTILKKASEFIRQKKEQGGQVGMSVVGRKGREYFKRRGLDARMAWSGISGKVQYGHAVEIGQDLEKLYLDEGIDEVYVVYNEFKSAISQQVVVERLLPIEPEDDAGTITGSYMFEPSPDEVLEELLPKHLQFQIFRMLLESSASEEGARMTAMDAANKNAKEVIRLLTLTYNRARQANITKEILEVVGGAEALKG